jgi:hypothetical protein
LFYGIAEFGKKGWRHIADAPAWVADGKIETDVEIFPEKVARCLEQLGTYRKETGGQRSARPLVFMTQSKAICA